jgi:hypothetical protein
MDTNEHKSQRLAAWMAKLASPFGDSFELFFSAALRFLFVLCVEINLPFNCMDTA